MSQKISTFLPKRFPSEEAACCEDPREKRESWAARLSGGEADFFEQLNISSTQAPPTNHLSQVEFGLPLGSQELRKWSPEASWASPALLRLARDHMSPQKEPIPETRPRGGAPSPTPNHAAEHSNSWDVRHQKRSHQHDRCQPLGRVTAPALLGPLTLERQFSPCFGVWCLGPPRS